MRIEYENRTLYIFVFVFGNLQLYRLLYKKTSQEQVKSAWLSFILLKGDKCNGKNE